MDFYEIIFTKKRLDKTDQFQINESFCAKTPQSRDSAERTLSESLLDLIYKIPNVKYLIHFIMGEKKKFIPQIPFLHWSETPSRLDGC